MTGPEHFAEAENRLRASDYGWQQATDAMDARGALREALMAQAHATLALAAATDVVARPGPVSLAGIEPEGYGR